jgi:hypothetical protein
MHTYTCIHIHAYAGPLSNAIEADGSAMGTGDRLSVTLTLLLTAVAYKFIVASSLPQVSYLTKLDIHVLLCFGFLVLIACENVVHPYLEYHTTVGGDFERYFVICYYIAFLLVHIVFFAKFFIWLLYRAHYFKEDLLIQKTLRAAYKVLPSVNGTDKKVAEYIADKVLDKKGLHRSYPQTHALHLYALGDHTKTKSASSKTKIGVEGPAEGHSCNGTEDGRGSTAVVLSEREAKNLMEEYKLKQQ